MRTGETYGEYQRRIYCENASILGSGCSIYPQCYNGKKEYEVIIIYNDVDKDILYLCKECLENLKKDCRKHGYKVKARKIKG